MQVILFCRTLLIVLAVGVCTVAAEKFETMLAKAEAGDAAAQHYLAWMYANGEGVPKDRAEAAKWIRKAAEQGEPETQYMLGEAYANGYGVPEDDVEAVKWYRKAAEQGHEKAQAQLESAELLASITPIERVLLKGEEIHAARPADDVLGSLKKRSAKLRMIDRTKCPNDFRFAWLAHCQATDALYKYIEAAQSTPDGEAILKSCRRGLQRGFAGDLAGYEKELRRLIKAISRTKGECERLATEHGSRTLEQLAPILEQAGE
ncbi:MAG: tetratricopeptide repeat protein [SAR324 cluster bacterium]|nr:tetratricopeptide repeat protein [SAR324 cluster bacterium]